MKFKNKKFVDIINEAMEANNELTSISVGQLILVWGVVPFMVGLNYVVLFGGITEPMAWTIFTPSIAITAVWYFCKNRKLFNKKLYF
jgi:hypothetical protein